MASLKRSKTMLADGQTAKFLYTILKQLDLKSIDWNLVASQLEITNGHAARMRFSRFRQHMEGITTTHRTPRPKKTKVDKTQSKKQQQFSEPKQEPTAKAEQMVKQETDIELNDTFLPMKYMPAPVPVIEQQPFSTTTVAPGDLALPYPIRNPVIRFSRPPPTAAEWSRIKMEKEEGDAASSPDGLTKIQ
ncbi:hypothetical protein GX48_07977 [Paracoccidioides brasiliensis]|nr:hypothetical protein GX48_07977 [Paracoccidioides brasiliensis]